MSWGLQPVKLNPISLMAHLKKDTFSILLLAVAEFAFVTKLKACQRMSSNDNHMGIKVGFVIEQVFQIFIMFLNHVEGYMDMLADDEQLWVILRALLSKASGLTDKLKHWW